MDWFSIRNPEKRNASEMFLRVWRNCGQDACTVHTIQPPWSEHPRKKLLITCCLWLLLLPQDIPLKLPHSLVNYFFSPFLPHWFCLLCSPPPVIDPAPPPFVSLLFVHLLHSLCVFIFIIYFQLTAFVTPVYLFLFVVFSFRTFPNRQFLTNLNYYS